MTQRYPGGFITKTPPTVSTSSAYGVWTLDQALQYIKAGTWPVSDPYFFYNTLLLPGNGTNGAQNNTFLDSSTNNFTITRNGNTTQGTFTPYGSNWSNYFDGSGDYLQLASNSAFNMNTYCCLEAWVCYSTIGTSTLIAGRDSSYWIGYNFTSIGGTANKFLFTVNTTGSGWQAVSSTTTPVAGVWYHVVGIKDNTTLRIYINGTQENTATFSGTANTPANVMGIGANQNTQNMAGYVSNVRLVLGASASVLPYTANFSPVTAPLTAVSGTALLTCQSNRYIDNSSNSFSITANGDTSVQRFSPFNPSAPYAPYAAGTIGGSGYFDGSGDYLSLPFTTPLQLGTGDFTIEFWMYAIGFGGVISQSVVDEGSGNNTGWTMLCGPASVGMYMQGFDISTLVQSGSYSRAWTHVAVTRSGTTFRLFVNGVLSKTLSGTYDMNAAYNVRPDTPTLVGTHELQFPNYYTGYVSSLRILKGSALYTATFTPPTAPLTAITNTQLLLNYTNGGIIDNAMMNDLETVGNAQISTTQSKFGGASMYFDGSGDYLNVPTTQNVNFGTGNFTIEFWAYWAGGAFSTYNFVFDSRSGASPFTDGVGIAANITNGYWYISFSGQELITSTAATAAWQHIALVRNNGVFTLYVNGISGGTYTATNNMTSTTSVIGTYYNRNQYYWSGYIDDFRITKGIARYTANFTPPTVAFPLS